MERRVHRQHNRCSEGAAESLRETFLRLCRSCTASVVKDDNPRLVIRVLQGTACGGKICFHNPYLLPSTVASSCFSYQAPCDSLGVGGANTKFCAEEEDGVVQLPGVVDAQVVNDLPNGRLFAVDVGWKSK